MRESRYFILKIVVGYVLIAAMCAAAVSMVCDKIDSSSAIDEEYELLEHRNELVDRTLMHLYRAESHAQMILAGDDRYASAYDADIEAALGGIDSLRSILPVAADSMKYAQLDTVAMLVIAKRGELLRLSAGMQQSEAAAAVIERNIERLAAADSLDRDSMVMQHTVVKLDTTVVQLRHRKFFRRFADLFSPPKTDTAMIVSTDIHTDSIPLRLKDTIGGVLTDLKYQMARERELGERRVARLRRDVAAAASEIDGRILAIIGQMKSDWDAHARHRGEERDAARREAISILGSVALSAVALVFVFLAVIFRDWRRNQSIRRQLERTNDEKQRLLDYREHLMLAVTHDLKTPTGSILGYLDLLERLDSGYRQRLYIDGMKQSAEHLQSLIESLLEFYRLDSDRAETVRRPFNAAHLFGNAVRDMAASRYAKKEVELAAQISPSADLIVESDPVRLRQIVDNLLSNALKFTQQGSVTLACRMEAGRLHFSISDTGCGMSLEETRRIFGSFVRLQSASGVEGFGLGLSIVERAVKLLGGEISVRSRRGEGSTFSVSLPVGRADAGSTRSAVEGIRILAVDDDKLQLDMLAAMCRTLSVDMERCSYPSYAADVAAGSHFDLLMTDIQMPECDGFEVLRRIREKGLSLPVAAVTARGDSSERELCARGFAAVLRKPYSTADLRRMLMRLADGGRVGDRTSEEGGARADKVDFAPLTAFADGDDAARRQLVEAFASQMRADAVALRRAAEAGSVEEIRSTAHRVRPMAEMVGAMTLAGSLHAAERNITECLPADISAAADQMERLADAAGRYAATIEGSPAE